MANLFFKTNIHIFNHTKLLFACKYSQLHVPVMLNEVIDSLKPSKNQTFIDMTFGAGGHSKKLLESAENVKIIALDRDPFAYNIAQDLSKEYPNQVVPLLGRFSDLPELLKQHKIRQNSIDGILFDFGCSSMQFDSADRGFSVSKNGPLDMRMDGLSDSPSAADVLAYMDEEDIAKILKVYGEEKHAKKIARAIVEARYSFKKLQTTEELAMLVDSVCTEEHRVDKLQRFSHSATKTFQALRIFVNNEINEINYGIVVAQKYLKIGGRLVAISFHSLEDVIVKRHILGNVIDNAINPLPLKYSDHTLCHDKEIIDSIMESPWRSLNKQIITPSYKEIESNPRSRSAKLRAAVRVS
ncbi:probable methyltransferase-like protein 15 homolog [Chrysoperla carnea]|uniref:probable methyltransferase-like protein 15 homolog n=1 Tax=Chrysoperla carnea TaxID=189513 RepID=UPI001D0831DC|nr:probable methyltransferase-like protein 15 homolog [Chrysoperla carnea]